MRTTLTIAALVASLLTLAAAAPAQSASLQCSGSVTALGPGEDSVETAWSNQVASSLGSAWSDLSLAKNKQYHDQNLGLGTIWTLTATPCRHALLVQQIGKIGILQLKQGTSPKPTNGRNIPITVKPGKFKFGG